MIKTVEGDILLSNAQVIAHGIAAMDPMNQGLAKSLHEKFPAMHKDFHHWCHQAHPKSGEAWMWGAPGGVRIVNLITQDGGYDHGSKPGPATVSNVSSALKALAKMAKAEKFTSIALPRVATGVGGLDWAEVEPLIERHLGDLEIPVYVYEVFHAGTPAAEN
jgi:O-acetyl-ADP-ribose deacetylase (regulator of RNase III)